jgi:hypothetical protein
VTTKKLAFLAGGASAVLSAVTAALIAGVDPGDAGTKTIVTALAVLQAGIAALAAYLQPGLSKGPSV